MDLGLTTGNVFSIPAPPVIKTELDLYIYLCLNKKAREEIIQIATDVRAPSWRGVWAHHEIVLFPLIIHPNTTEHVLLINIYRRLRILFMNGTDHL